ncbi:MAG: ribosome silencing factor [Gammaproteobacteria bacterium]|nr:MAG: ribosome silencing factor [Gammaproteobacteria bacterium]
MKSEELRDLAVNALEELKGLDIVTMDVRSLTAITDYMVICTGRSTRQVKALADNVALKAKQSHAPCVRTEGETESEWVLVDLGDVVVHVMLAATRAFYSLEDLWEPVKEMRDQKTNS